jgi:hypothetical protein
MLAGFDVTEARKLLVAAAEDLAWWKDEVLPSWIHPKLRRRKERLSTLASDQGSQYPLEFGVAKIDYWFIGQLDLLFDIFPTETFERFKKHRDKIIARIFEVAFAKFSGVEQIKTARLRMVRKRSKK